MALYIYESHLGGFYCTNEKQDIESLYCEQCGDYDTYLGKAENAYDVADILRTKVELFDLRSALASVKAPFSCPKSSESIVPSGMAPQLMAKYGPCLRAEKAWIIFGKCSLPTPDSPVTRTLRSVFATCRAISMPRLSNGLLPMMPNRCLIFCKSDWGSMF